VTSVANAGSRPVYPGEMRWFPPLLLLLGACASEDAPFRPSPEAVQKHVADLAPAVTKSADGLKLTSLAGGGVYVDTEGRMQAAMVARRDASGKLVIECVDSTAAAESFFRAEPTAKGATE
jgi:hypothetical protein